MLVVTSPGPALWPQVVTAIATGALVIVTFVYVVLVNRQVGVLRQQVAEQGKQWAAERELDRQERIRARSEQAASTELEAVYESGIRPGSSATDDRALHVFHALERRAPFVADPEVSDRMKATGVILWMSTWTDEQLRSSSVVPGVLKIQMRAATERCAWTLQAYLTDSPLPSWTEFPAYVRAQGWVFDTCH